MPTASLMDYLAGDALTKLAQAYANKMGVMRPLPPEFYAPSNNPNVGTTVSYDIVTATREAAQIVHPDSPPVPSPGVDSTNKKAVAIGSRMEYVITLEMIQALQSNGDIVRMNAQNELQKQVENFVSKFQTLRTDAVHSAFFKGKISISSAGVIQTTASSPIREIDYAIPAGNAITTATSDTVIVGDWSSAATDIPTALATMRRNQAKNYGFSVDTIIYGVKVPGYLAKNTLFKEYLARNPQYNGNYVSTGEIPNGVLGFNWIPAATATKVLAGTGTSWAGDSFLAAMPKIDSSWYEVKDCGICAPTGLTSEAELASALTSGTLSSAFPVRYGLHSYAVLNARTPSASLIVADYSLPIIKSPNAYLFGVCA